MDASSGVKSQGKSRETLSDLEELLNAAKTVLQKKEKILETIAVSRIFLELLGRFELPTSSLPMTRSTD